MGESGGFENWIAGLLMIIEDEDGEEDGNQDKD